MFIDKVTLQVVSGKGGDGHISFRREKYAPNGGPDGGDGGKGGDVVLVADPSVNTLAAFRFKHKFAAEAGEPGGQNNRSGSDKPDVIIPVPVGTVVFDADSGAALFDFTEEGSRYIAAYGGRGGKGNQHFATSTRQAPRFAKPGDDAEDFRIVLELKTIADVGLVGFPNVGKSTLLSRSSNAKPKIAAYPFTTLSPNLGVVRMGDSDFVMADIPGLIEGASQGAGLGHDFLRHVERTRLLIHVIDASGWEGRDPRQDFTAINEELFAYSPALKERQQVIALNKADAADRKELASLQEHFASMGYETFVISAVTGEGVDALLNRCAQLLADLPKTPAFFDASDFAGREKVSNDTYEISREGNVWYLMGEMPRRLLRTVNLRDYESREYFQRVLKNKGVFDALKAKGIADGDTLDVLGHQFEYYE